MPQLAECPIPTRGCNSPCASIVPDGVECFSIYDDWMLESRKFKKWIESEKLIVISAKSVFGGGSTNIGINISGPARVEHLQGTQFWLKLDRGDFGLLKREFRKPELRPHSRSSTKSGQENLQVIKWAIEWEIPIAPVMQILAALDINSRRLRQSLRIPLLK